MTALTLGFTIVFSYFPGLLGITASEKNAVSTEYAEKLFDKSSVTEIAVTVDPDAWEEMLENAAAEEYIACDVTIAGTTFTNVGIRPKGNTSSWLIKGNKKKGKAQSRRYQRQATRINCDYTRLVL